MTFDQVQVAGNASNADLKAALATANETIDKANAHVAELMHAIDLLKKNIDDAKKDLAACEASRAELQVQLEAVTKQADASKRSQHAGKGTHVRVSSAHPAGSHWRAGKLWAREAVDVEVKQFADEQLEAMRADRHLVVVDL